MIAIEFEHRFAGLAVGDFNSPIEPAGARLSKYGINARAKSSNIRAEPATPGRVRLPCLRNVLCPCRRGGQHGRNPNCRRCATDAAREASASKTDD